MMCGSGCDTDTCDLFYAKSLRLWLLLDDNAIIGIYRLYID